MSAISSNSKNEIDACGWGAGQRATVMLMPKASMDLDDALALRENDVGCTWQVCSVQPKPCPKSMRDPPDCEFRRTRWELARMFSQSVASG
jgi:hypothetical protein